MYFCVQEDGKYDAVWQDCFVFALVDRDAGSIALFLTGVAWLCFRYAMLMTMVIMIMMMVAMMMMLMQLLVHFLINNSDSDDDDEDAAFATQCG
jgi:hypothetical protein